eukprot:TRINITY_DN1249_c0_g1_i4.p1 TRINITY_DN1249_c0_g1~~TRINITY_DN1249_c0_g1_i4.p1  ORF type:complete len:380 (+),score=61.03 TRINITY_DN1249_c0_g1_i4:213-1352(+)
MNQSDQERAVAAVMAAMANKKAGATSAGVPLAILGKEDPAIKPTSLVVYSSTGRKLNFSAEELEKPPEAFKDNPKAQQKWTQIIPVYTRKALDVTHFQRMSVTQIRVIMERSVVKALEREKADRKKKTQKRNQLKENAKASECILIRNLVGRGELSDEIKEDVISEMQNHGNVVHATAHEAADLSLPDEESVRVFIRFSSKEEAVQAKQALHLRVFDGRFLAVSFFPLKRLLERDLEPNTAEDKLPKKCSERFTESDAAEQRTQEQPTVVSAPPAKPSLPEVMLPEHVQALIDVITLSAAHKEIPQELLDKADPLTASKRAAEEAAKIHAEKQRVLDEAQLETKKKQAAEIARKFNEQFESRKRKREVEKPTENLDEID